MLLRSAPSALSKRTLCAGADDGVQVDMVCRVWSGKVKDDAGAHALDCQFEEWLDQVAEVEGCAGASRLLCKTGTKGPGELSQTVLVLTRCMLLVALCVCEQSGTTR